MTVVFSVVVDKSEVEVGEEVVYTAHVQNDLLSPTVIEVTFVECMPNGYRRPLNIQTKEIGPGEAEYFNLYIVANQVAGYVYNICADAGYARTGFTTSSACAPPVTIRETSLGILMEECTANKTEVDVGGTVKYTANVRNATRLQQTVYIDFYDEESSTVLANDWASILPDGVATFEYTMVCNVPLQKLRVCARRVDVNGTWLGSSVYAQRVQVSDIPDDPNPPPVPPKPPKPPGGDIPIGALVFLGVVAIGGGLLYFLGPEIEAFLGDE